MKRLGVYLLTFFLVEFANGQSSFYRGTFVAGANLGFDAYQVQQRYFQSPENSTLQLNKMMHIWNYNMTIEYGLLKWLGVGVIERFDNYYAVGYDPVTHTIPSEGAVDFGGTVNLHVIRYRRFDLFGGYDWGISQLYYNVNDELNTQVNGTGPWSDLHATGRFYFDRFGLNFSLYAPFIKYGNLTNNNSSVGEYIVNYWKSSGYGASIGVQCRLL